MNEKTIIESKINNGRKAAIITFTAISTTAAIIGLFLFLLELTEHPRLSLSHSGEFWFALIASIFAISFLILFLHVCFSKIAVTDKRVYGSSVLGKKVDLPMDSISAVYTSAFMDGIGIATSAGLIKFYLISNYMEIHKELSLLLASRQKEETLTTVVKQNGELSSADELKKFKDLLDSGIISQEEFEAKKKQLLGL